MTVQLAMYKGPGHAFNALTRFWTGSEYSHCELAIRGVCYSSSLMDGGVRGKVINLESGHWDLIALPWVDAGAVLDHFKRTDHVRYGLMSLAFNQLLNRNRASESAQFCSEWCADALGLPNPATYSPATLMDLCGYISGRVPALRTSPAGQLKEVAL